MSLTLSSATSEVRTVPTCSDISENAHRLLVHLTRTRAGNKGTPRVRGDLDSWSRDLPMDREDTRIAFEAIGPDGDEFVQRDRFGRLVLWLPCKCGAARKTDSSISPGPSAAEQSGRRGVPELATPVSSLASCGRKKGFDEGGETPGQTAESLFLNGASADDEVEPGARPRVHPDSPYGLAIYFEDQVLLAARRDRIRLLPDCVAKRALVACMRDLLTLMSPAAARDLIKSFCGDYRRYHKPGVDPGRVFLAHRRRLFAEHEKRSTHMTERDINRYKKSGRKYSTIDDILGR